MNLLTPFLAACSILYFSLNYIYLNRKKSAIEIVNEMGIGYNLGNSFDCFTNEKINRINELITSKGNPVPTKKTIKSIKKYGFKTIRFPITWLNFIDEKGIINSEWMNRVKEVVNWIIDEKMFCIINVYNDGYLGNWLYDGLKVKDKYINLWAQIANEFKDYDEHLIFESMDSLNIFYNGYFDYIALNKLIQGFIDTIRESGGKNKERLLLISGAMNDLDLTYSSEYIMPIDQNNNLGISIHYYSPFEFTSTYNYEMTWYDENGIEYYYTSPKKWGSSSEYNEIIVNFEIMKKYFVDKGIPVILTEVGVLTEEKKEIESIREYIYSIFSISVDYDGIMACLWDTSSKDYGNMNYYNRENNKWYDEKIKDNFKIISKGKYIKPIDYIIMTNIISVDNQSDNGYISIKIGERKPIRIIFNVNINNSYSSDSIFDIISYNSTRDITIFSINRKYRKKEYDGTYTFTVNVNDKDLKEFIEVDRAFGDAESASFNYLTIEFQEQFLSIDNKAYKSAISNFILN